VKLFVCLLAVAMFCVSCASHRHAAVPAPSAAHAPSKTLSTTLETSDERLRTALFKALGAPSAASFRDVGKEYRRLGVLDAAADYFMRAVKLDPTDAVSFDALARIWRDWGVPKMAMGSAQRAVLYAPRSASAANTLGTVFQALGEFSEAKRWYARAIGIDQNAWYALNNLCYAQIMTKEPYAIETCKRAVAAAPDTSVQARTASNNLALAHAAAGDLVEAKQWFRRAGDVASADYNYGIVMMSKHDYREAEAAFHSALDEDPDFTLAATRAQQARLAAAAEEQTR